MIGDEGRLGEVLEEIADWDLGRRRRYIDQIAKANGEAAAQQIRDGLTGLWRAKKCGE